MKFLENFLSCWKFPIKGKLSKKSKSKPQNSIPLFNLPRVVLLECIENLDVLEIIIFSLLSKRAKSIAKLIRWNPLNIHLTSEEDPQIWFKLPNVPGLEWVIDYNKQYESSVYPAFHSVLKGPKTVHYLILHDNGNFIEDIKQMTEHVCEVFRSPIAEILIFDESLIEWIINFQPTIRHVRIREDVIASVETLERISKSLQVTDFLGMEPVAIDEKFQITEPITSRSLIVWNSFWVTLPSILNGNNSIILLRDSQLTPKDINTILKEWQKGTKLQNLEYLEIKTPPIYGTGEDAENYTGELFRDLNLAEIAEHDGRPMTVEIHNEWTYTLRDVETMSNLIRNDGMIGSIFEIVGEFKDDALMLSFYFQVWSNKT